MKRQAHDEIMSAYVAKEAVAKLRDLGCTPGASLYVTALLITAMANTANINLDDLFADIRTLTNRYLTRLRELEKGQ